MNLTLNPFRIILGKMLRDEASADEIMMLILWINGTVNSDLKPALNSNSVSLYTNNVKSKEVLK